MYSVNLLIILMWNHRYRGLTVQYRQVFNYLEGRRPKPQRCSRVNCICLGGVNKQGNLQPEPPAKATSHPRPILVGHLKEDGFQNVGILVTHLWHTKVRWYKVGKNWPLMYLYSQPKSIFSSFYFHFCNFLFLRMTKKITIFYSGKTPSLSIRRHIFSS